MKHRVKRCQRDGPSWPFTTSLTLKALAKLIRDYRQDVVSRRDFFRLMKTYARSQHRILPYGEEIPWIGENLHPHSGIWLARAIMLEGRDTVVQDMNQAVVRGKDYNHSLYCDLVISDLVGFRPGEGDSFTVYPLVPEDEWDWFCLDGIPFRNHNLTVMYDRTGRRYGRGKGLKVYSDGKKEPI